MPDLKISQLPVASTPLAGTELVPIVQGGITEQTTVESFLRATVPSGTANGVLYLNGSKVATSGSALVFDGSNLGIGVTPSAWSGVTALQIAASGAIASDNANLDINANAYYNAGYKYIRAQAASRYTQTAGAHQWFNAPSGTAGNAISFTQAMTLDASGNLGVGTTSPGAKLDVAGTSAKLTNNTSADVTVQIGPDVPNSTRSGRIGFITSSVQKNWYIANNWNVVGGLEFTQTTIAGGSTMGGTPAMTLDASGNLIQSAPTTPPTLSTNGTMVFNLTSNTNLRVSVRGSDGVTRVANITLA